MTAITLLAAAVVGALLGLSGRTLQGVFRNPLAEPYMLGVTGGAALALSVVMRWCGMEVTGIAMSAVALAGAAFSLLLVGGVAFMVNRRGTYLAGESALTAPGDKVVLAGFMVASLTCSLQMLVLCGADDMVMVKVNRWLFGSFAQVTRGGVIIAAVVLGMVLLGLLGVANRLDLLGLGADRAECLGVNSLRLMVFALLMVSIASAVAVSLAGSIGFVGLVAPHLARLVSSGRYRIELPLSALMGAFLMMVAALSSEILPGNLPVGVMAALLGAPFFVWLLVRRS